MSLTATTLGEIAEKAGGTIQTGPFGSQLHRSDYQSEGTPVIMPQDIVNDRVSTESIARVGPEMVRKLPRHQLKEGDIVFPRRGDLNKRVIITEEQEGWLCGTGCLKISVAGGPVHPRYLFYYLKQPRVVRQIEQKAVGATMLNLNTSILSNLVIKYPALAEQQRLASILSAYDDLIANNNRRIALLEEAIHRLYREWFVHLRFPGYEHTSIIDGVPERWEKRPASEAVEINPSTSVEKGLERPFVPMASLSTESMLITDIEARPAGGGAKFKNGDTLLARITPSLENGKTGFVQFMEGDEEVATGSTEFIVLRSAHLTPYWVYCLARTHEFRQHAINSMVGSDGRQRVQPDSIARFPILVPYRELLDEFDGIATPIFQKIHNLNTQNERLSEARDALLPRLMNGSLAI